MMPFARGFCTVKKVGVARTYATLDPTKKGSLIALSNGNLTATYNGAYAWQHVQANIGKEIAAGGKWYFEVTINAVVAGNYRMHGCANRDASVDAFPGASNDSVGSQFYALPNGVHYYNGIVGSISPPWTLTNGMVLGCLIDLDAKTIAWTKDGTNWITHPTSIETMVNNYSGTPKKLYPAFGYYTSTVVETVNFGASAFTYSVPSGANPGWYE